ncbi:MAG: hypothetical protein MI750_02520 [Xanthomonadales bacterium]|nr:hypothetical protein [Xanthomonadales bacterium]
MNLEQMQSAWTQQNQQINEQLEINTDQLTKQRFQSHQNELKQLTLARWVEAIVFFVLQIALWQYLVGNWGLTAPALSAGVLTVFATIGLAGTIGQIVLLQQVDFSAPIKTLQQQLASVRSHSMAIFKLLLLSAPFYLAYVFLGFDVLMGVDLYQHLSLFMKTFYVVTSLLILIGVVVFIQQIRYSNIHKPWVAWCYREFGGSKLTTLLNALDEFERE